LPILRDQTRFRADALEQTTNRSKVNIQVFLRKAEFLNQPINFLGLAHQRYTEVFNLFIGQSTPVNSPNCLTLENFMKKSYQCQYQLPKALSEIVGI